MVAVRQLDLHAKFVADVDVFLPTGKTASNAYLLQASLLPLTVFGDDRRRNVEREADMLALADRHFAVRGEQTTATAYSSCLRRALATQKDRPAIKPEPVPSVRNKFLLYAAAASLPSATSSKAAASAWPITCGGLPSRSRRSNIFTNFPFFKNAIEGDDEA